MVGITPSDSSLKRVGVTKGEPEYDQVVSVQEIYCQTLLELLDQGEPIVFVEADVMTAAGTAPILERYPDRVINVGIAEQNAVSVASGLSAMGLIPFVNTFAVLLS